MAIIDVEAPSTIGLAFSEELDDGGLAGIDGISWSFDKPKSFLHYDDALISAGQIVTLLAVLAAHNPATLASKPVAKIKRDSIIAFADVLFDSSNSKILQLASTVQFQNFVDDIRFIRDEGFA